MKFPARQTGLRALNAKPPHSFVLLAGVTAFVWSAPALATRSLTSSFSDFVTQVRVFMPGQGSNGYVVPTPEERLTFTAAANALLAGDVQQAEAALAASPGFEVLDLHDSEGGGEYLAIAEKVPPARGWGFFFFSKQATRARLVVEAPHPLADQDSELLAARAVTALGPLLVGAAAITSFWVRSPPLADARWA